jgi:hypothetical protein
MRKMILTVATLLAISGSALAGSNNYGSNSSNQPAVSIDNTDTGSTSKPTEPATRRAPPGAPTVPSSAVNCVIMAKATSAPQDVAFAILCSRL